MVHDVDAAALGVRDSLLQAHQLLELVLLLLLEVLLNLFLVVEDLDLLLFLCVEHLAHGVLFLLRHHRLVLLRILMIRILSLLVFRRKVDLVLVFFFFV